jgi:hypothetical protein
MEELAAMVSLLVQVVQLVTAAMGAAALSLVGVFPLFDSYN